MESWNLLFLPEVSDDLEELSRGDGRLPEMLRAAIDDALGGSFKASRLLGVISGHGRTHQVEHFADSGFPKSYRLQLHHDYRALICCVPPIRVVLVTHVFAKSDDPNYRAAAREHDRRLESYFLPFKEFVERAEERRRRRL